MSTEIDSDSGCAWIVALTCIGIGVGLMFGWGVAFLVVGLFLLFLLVLAI